MLKPRSKIAALAGLCAFSLAAAAAEGGANEGEATGR
jgi:hypothetical protein